MIGERIRARLAAVEMSQAELARRVGISQPAVNALIRGASRSSTHLHRIARELLTTPSYLEGETDDPDAGAPPPPPALPPQLFLRVELPDEEALAAMFESLLDGLNPADPRDEQARQLAQRLPIGLSQLVDARRAPVTRVRRQASSAAREADLATADLGRRS